MFIYIHIPFCLSHCIYCDFYVTLAKHGGQAAYVESLLREIEIRFERQPPSGEAIQTVYFGGGTPSLLNAGDYVRIFDKLKTYADFAPDAEITLEANPNAMAGDPESYLEAGFNRISVGVQSFVDLELKKLSRIHTAQEASDFIRHLQTSGYQNISLDLMYGIPLQTMASWRETFRETLSLGIQHISMYGLKVEETTPLHRLATFESYRMPFEDETVEMYFEAVEAFEAAGFNAYEISNLAQPGLESRHNLNYWNNGYFYGFGAGAHGYVNELRTENIRDLASYLTHPITGSSSATCSQKEKMENAIMLGLRKSEGINIEKISEEFGFDFLTRFGFILDKFKPLAFLKLEDNMLSLTREAIPISNSIMAEFIDV